MGIQETVSLVDVDPADYDMLYVPGGLAPTELRTVPAALDFVRAFAAADKPVGLVCHCPQMLVSAGLAQGRRTTSSYEVRPEVEEAGGTWVDETVVEDGPFITARKPGDLPAELHAIMQRLDKQQVTQTERGASQLAS
ncbi:DJ-1/PfpI family protein [Streptomyces sp. NPDC097941]|uniref:DJ-1/PfpI family protein n=1 Tax=Streptomyces sp. NPDC097941 TaxID=3155685 RepID=UPI00331F4D5C